MLTSAVVPRAVRVALIMLAFLVAGCTAQVTPPVDESASPDSIAEERRPEITVVPVEPVERQAPTPPGKTRIDVLPDEEEPLVDREIQPVTVEWSSTRLVDTGVVSVEDSLGVQYLHELQDGTLVGIGKSETDETVSILSWTGGDVTAAPRRAVTTAPMVFSSAILDDTYVALGAIRDFDAGEAHVEIWDLRALDLGPVWRDEGIWVIEGQILDLEGPGFVLAGRRTATEEHEVAIRSIDDPDAREFVLDGYHGFLTRLDDGRVATSGVTIFDPAEPERTPVDSGAWGVYNLRELQDGRIASGWTDTWRVHDSETGEVEEFPWPYERNIASPAPFGDDQVIVNVNDGIEMYALDDLTQPVATVTTPTADGSAQVYGLGLTVTDTHAVGLDLTGNGLWVFDLTQPDRPATSFNTGNVLAALNDGRIASQGPDGVMIWDPAGVTGGDGEASNTYRGAVCAVAVTGDQAWAGTDNGAVIGWDRTLVDAEPFVDAEAHASAVIAISASGDTVASVAEDGSVLIRDAATRETTASIETSLPLVSAAIVGDLVALGESDGSVSVLDLSTLDSSAAEPTVTEPSVTELFVGEGTTATSVGVLPDGRVTVMHLDGILRVFDPGAAPGDQTVAVWDLGQLASEHAVSPDGLIVAPTEDAVLVFDPDDADAGPRSLRRSDKSDYFPPFVLSDGTVVVVQVDGVVTTADPISDDQLVPVAELSGGLSGRCMSAAPDGQIAYVTNRRVVIADVGE